MESSKFKPLFSLSNMGGKLKATISRFPVALTMLVTFVCLLCFCVITELDPGKSGIALLYFLAVGCVIDIIFSLWNEEYRNTSHRLTAEIIVLFLCAAYCFYLTFRDNYPTAVILANVAWVVTLLIALPFVSYLREKNDVKVWHFIFATISALIISGLVAGFMSGSLLALIEGIGELFNVTIPEKVQIICILIFGLLLFGVLFMMLIPSGEAKHNEGTTIPRIALGITKWLILPLLGCYMVVLYVYMLKIIVTWELPKGMLSWLVSAVVIGYVVCYTVLYPQIKDGADKLLCLMIRWIPIVILPLLVLMTVGVVRRFVDYGLTAPRLYLATLLAWYYAVCLLIIFLHNRRFHWIYLSLALLLLLTSGHPFNYYNICKLNLVHNIDVILQKYDIELPADSKQQLWDRMTAVMPEEEADAVIKKIDYISNEYGNSEIQNWITGFWYGTITRPNTLDIQELEYDDYEERVITIYQLPQYNDENGGQYQYPEGDFRYFRKIVSEYAIVPKSKIIDGVIEVDYYPNKQITPEGIVPSEVDCITLLFDTLSIISASQAEKHLIVPSKGKAVFVPDGIDIYDQSIDSVSVWYDGFLFE